MKKYVLAVAAMLLLGWLTPDRATAQLFAPGEVPYLRAHIGASSYSGDRIQERSMSNFFTNQLGLPSLGVEFGYRYRSGPYGVNLGFYYTGAIYEQINRQFSEGDRTVYPAESSPWRHTLGFVGQLGFRPTAKVDPYVRLGVGTTFGRVNSFTSVGRSEYEMVFSPILGGGVEVALDDRLGLFAEVDFIGSFPDDNIDKADGRRKLFDILGFYGVGIRYDIGHLRFPDLGGPEGPAIAEAPVEEEEEEPEPAEPPPAPEGTPVQVLALDGPSALQIENPGTFRAEVNEDEASGALTYIWNFGDGATDTGLETTHRYQRPGTYTVSFTASGDYNTATEELTVNVSRSRVPGVPEAISLYSMQNPAAVGAPVRFNSRVRGDVPLTYTWDFGDGTPPAAVGDDPSHRYQAPGRYEVLLTVRNSMGTDTATVVQEVYSAACFRTTSLPAVYFEASSAELSGEAREVLQRNLELLEQCPNLGVRVEGYATGGEENARQLANERAQAVEELYLEGDIAPERIQSYGLGAPTGPGVDAEEFRRVDSSLITR